MMKQRIIAVLLVSAVLISLLLCGTILAYMFKQTDEKNNEFTPAQVTCVVDESFDGETKSRIQVRNTSNIDAYLRVRLVSYWVDADGNIVAKPSQMPQIQMAAGWLKGSNDTYYYQESVSPNALTADLLSAAITLEQDPDTGYRQVLEVFSEAIQSEPTKAVSNSWHVTIDANGYISKVS